MLQDHADLQLEATAPPLSEARRWVAEKVPGMGESRLVDLLLVVNSLLANAYEHAVTPCRLRLSRPAGRDVVRVEVDDASPELLPVLGRPGWRNRGLLLVNRLSSHWGVQRSRTRKTVWAEVVA